MAVDKAMSHFTGRSSDAFIIPNKPMAAGFKIWALAQLGYCVSWIFHQKSIDPVRIKKLPKAFIKTIAMVSYLLNQLPELPYCVQLYSLFTSHS